MHKIIAWCEHSSGPLHLVWPCVISLCLVTWLLRLFVLPACCDRQLNLLTESHRDRRKRGRSRRCYIPEKVNHLVYSVSRAGFVRNQKRHSVLVRVRHTKNVDEKLAERVPNGGQEQLLFRNHVDYFKMYLFVVDFCENLPFPSLSVYFDPIITKIFSSLSGRLSVSWSLVTFSVIQSSVDDWQG